MPELREPGLAHAALHVARAPKSNAACRGISLALAHVANEAPSAVPMHLRDAHYKGAAALGHVGYAFLHDDGRGWSDQAYAPDVPRGAFYQSDAREAATRVHPDAASARAALSAAQAAAEEAARAESGAGDPSWGRVAEAAWRLATPLAAQASGWFALRLASRLLPGAAPLVAAADDAAAAERLAARTIAAYREPVT